MLLQRQGRQMQPLDKGTLRRRLAIAPEQHKIRLQAEQALGIQMLRISVIPLKNVEVGADMVTRTV